MAAIKGKSKLKSLLSKIFRNLDNEDTADLVNNVVILQHLKGKSVEQVIAELRKEKVDAEKNKDIVLNRFCVQRGAYVCELFFN